MNSEPADSARYFQNPCIRGPYITECTVLRKRTLGEIRTFNIMNLGAARLTAALLKPLVEELLKSFCLVNE